SLAGTAEEAEAAALAFKVGPGAHETRAFVERTRHLDLKPAFGRARTQAENFEDQPGAVDDLHLEVLFEIALLHRRERAVDNQEIGVGLVQLLADRVELAGAKQARGV